MYFSIWPFKIYIYFNSFIEVYIQKLYTYLMDTEKEAN